MTRAGQAAASIVWRRPALDQLAVDGYELLRGILLNVGTDSPRLNRQTSLGLS